MKRKHTDNEVSEKVPKKNKSSNRTGEEDKKSKKSKKDVTAPAVAEVSTVEAESDGESSQQIDTSTEIHDVSLESIDTSKTQQSDKAEAVKKPETKPPSWDDYNLDPRILMAIAEQKFEVPTLVQSKVLPLAFEGHDILGAYSRPVLFYTTLFSPFSALP